MMCQIIFSKKNKKVIISLSSAEFGHSMVSVNVVCLSLCFAGWGPQFERKKKMCLLLLL